jgi:hypothetical protein
MVDVKTSQVTTPRRGPLQALRISAMVFGTAVLVQFYLAGTGIFGVGTNPLWKAPSLDAHRLFGNILAGLALVVLIIAIIARPPARILIATIVMLVLTGVEGLIAGLGKTSAYLAAFHPVLAAVILGLAFVIPLWTKPLVTTS